MKGCVIMNGTILCFHKPDGENGFLSPQYKSIFTADNEQFVSVHQYMVYIKACIFDDTISANMIMRTSDNAELSRLSQNIRNFNEEIWNGNRQLVLYNGLVFKYSQDSRLLSLLARTNQSVLAECSVNNRIWGIGLSITDPNRFDMSKWRGQNMIGFTTMVVRDNLI